MRGLAAIAGAALGVSALVAGVSPVLAGGLLGIDTPPVPLPDVYVTTVGQELDVSIANGVLANDVDADGDVLKARDGTKPKHGDLNLDNEGSFRYRPTAGYVGTDTFTYFADDGTVEVAALVTITILPLSTPAPTPTPAPTAKPTATPTATPTPAPTPTPVPLPSLLPSLLPTPPSTRPPTPTPSSTLDASPTAPASGTPGPSPTPSATPGGSTPAPGGGTGTGTPGPGRTPGPSAGNGDGDGSPASSEPAWLMIPIGDGGDRGGGGSRTPIELSGGPIAFSGAAFAWAVPGAVLAVPGLLVVLAVALQVIAGAAWLPVARRRLGGSGGPRGNDRS